MTFFLVNWFWCLLLRFLRTISRCTLKSRWTLSFFYIFWILVILLLKLWFFTRSLFVVIFFFLFSCFCLNLCIFIVLLSSIQYFLSLLSLVEGTSALLLFLLLCICLPFINNNFKIFIKRWNLFINLSFHYNIWHNLFKEGLLHEFY